MRSEAELKEMLGALSPAETQALRESITAEGVREPIVLWSRWTCPDCGEVVAPRNTGDEWVCANCGHVLTEQEYEDAEIGGVLVDGYNRFGLAVELDIDFPVRFVTFADREEAKAWIARNQLGRRNIGADKAAYCRGILYNESKQEHGGARASGQNVHLKTGETIAEQFGVNEKTVRRDGQFAEAVDALEEIAPGTRAKALNGEIPKQRVVEAGRAAKAGNAQAACAALSREEVDRRAAAAGKKAEEVVKEQINDNMPAPAIIHASRLLESCGGLRAAIEELLICVPAEAALAEITAAIKLLRDKSVALQRRS